MTAVNSKSAFFFLKEAGKHVNDNGKIVTLVTSLLGAFPRFYAAYAGARRRSNIVARGGQGIRRARHFREPSAPAPWTRRSSIRRRRGRGRVPQVGSRAPPFSATGLTDIADVVPFIRHLVSDGWWITGQAILINGGYTTK